MQCFVPEWFVDVKINIRLTLVFWFVDATFRSGDIWCRVWKSREKAPEIFEGHL